MLFKEIEKNKTNEKTIHVRTDLNKSDLIYADAKKNNKSINLIINEIIAKHYGLSPTQ